MLSLGRRHVELFHLTFDPTATPLEKSVPVYVLFVFVCTDLIFSHTGLVKVEWDRSPLISFLLTVSTVCVLSKHAALWVCGLIPCQCENALIH